MRPREAVGSGRGAARAGSDGEPSGSGGFGGRGAEGGELDHRGGMGSADQNSAGLKEQSGGIDEDARDRETEKYRGRQGEEEGSSSRCGKGRESRKAIEEGTASSSTKEHQMGECNRLAVETHGGLWESVSTLGGGGHEI